MRMSAAWWLERVGWVSARKVNNATRPSGVVEPRTRRPESVDDVVVRGAPFCGGGESVEGAQRFLESITSVDAGPVVEQDRHDVLGVRAEIMNEKGPKPGFCLPRKQVETVSRHVGPQSAPLTARIIGVDGSGPIAELRRPACSGANGRRRDAGNSGRVDDKRHGSGDGDRQAEQARRDRGPTAAGGRS